MHHTIYYTNRQTIQCSFTCICSSCCYWTLLIICIQLIYQWIRPSSAYSLFWITTHINFEEPYHSLKSHVITVIVHLCITVIVQLGTHVLPWTMIENVKRFIIIRIVLKIQAGCYEGLAY